MKAFDQLSKLCDEVPHDHTQGVDFSASCLRCRMDGVIGSVVNSPIKDGLLKLSRGIADVANSIDSSDTSVDIPAPFRAVLLPMLQELVLRLQDGNSTESRPFFGVPPRFS